MEASMNDNRPRSAVKSIVAILCAACFLTMTLGTVPRAFAAEEWPVWPKKGAEPGVETKPTPPPARVGASKAGETAGGATSKGMSAGTIGLIAAGTVVLIGGIAIAAGGGGGGGGGSTTPVHP
jgi:hypothetical protein